jgi:DNA-binding transcriptional MerR regulator
MKRSAYLESVTRVPNRLQLTCVHDFRFSKKMSNDGQMREFDWKNDDVKEVLQKLRDKRMTLTEVEKFLRESYNQKMCRASIYSHCPATPAADVYLPGNDVLRLQTKFDHESRRETKTRSSVIRRRSPHANAHESQRKRRSKTSGAMGTAA